MAADVISLNSPREVDMIEQDNSSSESSPPENSSVVTAIFIPSYSSAWPVIVVCVVVIIAVVCLGIVCRRTLGKKRHKGKDGKKGSKRAIDLKDDQLLVTTSKIKEAKIKAMKEFTAAYRLNMEKIIAGSDDDNLISHHQSNAKNACEDFRSRAPFSDDDVMEFKINLIDTFLDVVDSIWTNNKTFCLEALDQIKKKILNPETKTGDSKQDYWSALKDIQSEYKSEIGDSLYSKMDFVYLEDLDKRQEIDNEVLEVDLEEREDETTWSVQRMLIKLQLTWGRLLVFVMHWITSRKQTIDLMEDVSRSLKNETYFLNLDIDDHEFPRLSCDFANAINKDLRCRKLLIAQLEKFLIHVKSRRAIKCLSKPMETFMRISKFKADIPALTPDILQKDSNNSLEIWDKIVERERNVKGISMWLANCSSRSLVHLRDVLKKLKDENRLNKEGLTEVIEKLREQHAEITTMFSESLRLFFDAIDKADTSFKTLCEDICKWAPKRDDSISHLKVLATKLYETSRNSAIAQVTGSSVGAAGVAVIVGGAILAPFTAGISLTATALAGGAISVAGAVTTVGTTFTELAMDKKLVGEAETCIAQDHKLTETIEKQIKDFNEIAWLILRYIPPDAIEAMFSAACSSLSSMPEDFGKAIGINVVRLVTATGTCVAMPIVKSFLRGVTSIYKGVAATVTRSIAAVGLLLDVINICQNAMKLHAKEKPETAKRLEEVADKLEKAKEEIIKTYLDGKLPTDK